MTCATRWSCGIKWMLSIGIRSKKNILLLFQLHFVKFYVTWAGNHCTETPRLGPGLSFCAMISSSRTRKIDKLQESTPSNYHFSFKTEATWTYKYRSIPKMEIQAPLGENTVPKWTYFLNNNPITALKNTGKYYSWYKNEEWSVRAR